MLLLSTTKAVGKSIMIVRSFIQGVKGKEKASSRSMWAPVEICVVAVLCPRLGCATDEPKPLVELTASKRRNPYSESSYIVFPPSSFLLFLLFSQTGYLDFHFGLILAISAWFWPFWDVLGLFGLSFLLNNLSVKTVKMKGAGEGKQLKWRGGGERKTIKNEEEEEEGKQ